MKPFAPARIFIVKPGWFTTVQDRGRFGYQQFGVSASGAMDRPACLLANRLVGNREEAAALEITLKGPELLFERDAVAAITGADLTPSVNGIAVPLWTSLVVPAGSRLEFGARRAGARCYLAIAGGIDVPVVWGSRSTHPSSRTGGLQGRALVKGDVLVGGRPGPRAHDMIGRLVPAGLRPHYSNPASLRIVPGPQLSSFVPGAIEALVAKPYRLSSHSDRMGYRLVGPKLAHTGPQTWISDGTAMGALQVPADEQPILLMADRQTTGGYPKIAVVISADLHVAGQLAPGDAVLFTKTTLAEAQALFRAQRSALDEAVPPVSGH